MSHVPEAIVNPVVQDSGFTLVEEDDVAFSLALSREIHRLYGSYLEGDLPGEGQVWAGLDLTRRMVQTLESSVTAGMPSMRLQVAASQTREMLAVLFGDQAAAQRVKRSTLKHVAPDPLETAPSAPTPLTAAPAAPPVEARAPLRERAIQLWNRQPAIARLGIGLLLCVLTAVLINVPIAVMALYPNHVTEIGGLYGVIAAITWRWRRKRGPAPNQAAAPLVPA